MLADVADESVALKLARYFRFIPSSRGGRN